MKSEIQKIPVVSFSTFGQWHRGPQPPNGCCAAPIERWVQTVSVYDCDYYGRGLHRYADTKEYLQSQSGFLSLVNLTSDGYPDRIAKLTQGVL